MKFRKIDEELVIIAGVVILGIVIVLGITTQTFKFSDGISTISVIIAALALYYSKRVRGLEFNLTEARSTQRKEELTHITVLVQNTGDRMGYLRWDKISIKLGEKIIQTEKEAYKELTRIFASDEQVEKGFSFPLGKHEDLTKGMFVAEGVYSSHKGKGMISDTWIIPLTGKLKPIKEEKRRIEDDS
ncbi:MAG: hypothetical protein ACFE8J_08770 [Candidatus Heimdallarchaeota archaeon]